MKYLVNRETKEHKVTTDTMSWGDKYWLLVEADSDGWIPHTGNECPLPDDVRCAVKCADGSTSTYSHKARQWGWKIGGEMSDITHYKPIRAEKVQGTVTDERERKCAELQKNTMRNPKSITEMIKESDVKASPCMDVITRLSIAHRSAQTIPDLEAELREVLGSMGYDLVRRSPFVEAEPAVETPQSNALCTPNVTDAIVYGTSVMKNGKHVPLKDFYVEPTDDMSDWRNWREGDLVECINDDHAPQLCFGDVLSVLGVYKESGLIQVELSTFSYHTYDPVRFRFHSRPAKGER